MPVQWNYFDVMQRFRKLYDRALEPVCRQWNLTRNELDVLLFLANNPGKDRAADIVSNRGISKSHVSMSVCSLEARGLLVRREDPKDRRTVHLELTGGAAEIVNAGREVQETYFRRIFEGISRKELDLWREFTDRVCENIVAMEA